MTRKSQPLWSKLADELTSYGEDLSGELQTGDLQRYVDEATSGEAGQIDIPLKLFLARIAIIERQHDKAGRQLRQELIQVLGAAASADQADMRTVEYARQAQEPYGNLGQTDFDFLRRVLGVPTENLPQ